MKQRMLAPIALFVYKRLDHTKMTIEALRANQLASESDMIIFSDGPKTESDKESVERVRSYLRTISGFKTIEIKESPNNNGLARSIINGVTDVLKKYDSIIVVEDDLVSSPFFLMYMNNGLSLYQEDTQVISIHGYIYPLKKKLPETFFLKGADCWGWATWRRGWDLFEHDGALLLSELERLGLCYQFDYKGAYPYTEMLKDQIRGRNDSWAIRWYASAFLKEKLTLYPGESLINNIGHDNSGSHSGKSSVFDVDLRKTEITLKRIPLKENVEVKEEIAKFFSRVPNTRLKKLLRKLAGLFLLE